MNHLRFETPIKDDRAVDFQTAGEDWRETLYGCPLCDAPCPPPGSDVCPYDDPEFTCPTPS